MAIVISKTPTLKGKEAQKFQKIASANRKRTASKRELRTAVSAFVSVIENQERNILF